MEAGAHGQTGVRALLLAGLEPEYERENALSLSRKVVARNAKVQASKLVTVQHSRVQVRYDLLWFSLKPIIK